MENRKPGIYKLNGVIRNYDWGGTEYLSRLLSYPNPQKRPMAEYWLGAHDLAPSIMADHRDTKINELISADKERCLGPVVAKRFGRLPYLLKVLDVRDMLSIQVHPAKHEAEMEFAEENKQGIALDAPNRNYKDDNHKPELMVALSQFWLLHGFKPVEKLKATLDKVPELKPLAELFIQAGYDQLYKTAMEMPQETVTMMLQPLLDRIVPLYRDGKLEKSDERFWAARAAVTFNRNGMIDRGIFSIFFFNLVSLTPGEGIFQAAGIPHAYLEGQNVEIMANSDNVLRGGLTSKHIDVNELMKHIRFEEVIPLILKPEIANDHERLYRTAAPDFKLTVFQMDPRQTYSFKAATAEILLVMKGKVLLQSGPGELPLDKGDAAIILYGQEASLTALQEADVYRASVPVHHGE